MDLNYNIYYNYNSFLSFVYLLQEDKMIYNKIYNFKFF